MSGMSDVSGGADVKRSGLLKKIFSLVLLVLAGLVFAAYGLLLAGWVAAVVNFAGVVAAPFLYRLVPGLKRTDLYLTGRSRKQNRFLWIAWSTAGAAALVELGLWERSAMHQLAASLLVGGLLWPILAVLVVGSLWWASRVRGSRALTVVTSVAAVAAVGVLSYMFAVGSYEQSKLYLAHVQEVTLSQSLRFEPRAAVPVAHAQAPNSMTTVGDLKPELSTYIPQQDRFTTLVESKEWFGGYTEVVNQKVALTGQSTHSNCAFAPAAKKRLGGWFDGSLTMTMAQQVGFGTVWEESDAYGFCDSNGTAMVVQPLLRTEGVWPAVYMPAGVALYNGNTGEIRIMSGAEAATLPGPTVSEAWAHHLWGATRASADWWSYQQGTVGFGDTSNDPKDPNAENRSEFLLKESGGETMYVSPLTNRGSGSGITALAVVSATASDQVPTMRILKFSPEQQRQSNSAAVDRIKMAFGDLPWASGLQVFELSPLQSDGVWVASIGLRQNVLYRAELGPDGSACLKTASGKSVRCVLSSDTSAPGSTPAGSAAGLDLSKLSDAELAVLVGQVDAEVQKRLSATGR